MKPSPRATIWSLLPLLSAALLATATQSYSARVIIDPMVSNLGNTDSGNLPVSNTGGSLPLFQANTLEIGSTIFQANSFTTGNTATQLKSVTLSMNTASTPNPSGGFSVSIYSSGLSGPNVLLASLMGESNPAIAGLYPYTVDGSLQLDANTSYFVVAAVPTSPPQGYNWNYSTNGAEVTANGWSIGDQSWSIVAGGATSLGGGPSWITNGPASAAMFAVQAIPEPGLMLPLPVLLASGLMLRLRRK